MGRVLTVEELVIDKQIDAVLSAVRSHTPNPATEQKALNNLLTTLGGA